MFTIICRLFLFVMLVLGIACATFEATAATPAFRLLPQLRLKNQNRMKLLHRPNYRTYKPSRYR